MRQSPAGKLVASGEDSFRMRWVGKPLMSPFGKRMARSSTAGAGGCCSCLCPLCKPQGRNLGPPADSKGWKIGHSILCVQASSSWADQAAELPSYQAKGVCESAPHPKVKGKEGAEEPNVALLSLLFFFTPPPS